MKLSIVHIFFYILLYPLKNLKMKIYMYMYESLSCIPEMNTTLLIYAPI